MWICSYLVMQMANVIGFHLGVGPQVNQKDCKMGGAKLIIPPRSGGIRKRSLIQLLLNGKSP